jgi:tetratricopeptide (TPR) repeat protein
MSRLRIDDVTQLLPAVEELRPLLDRLIASSSADPERRWTVSGELGTVGERLADPGSVRGEVAALVDRMSERLGALYAAVLDGLEALERGDRDGAVRAFLRASAAEEDAGRMERAEAYAHAAAQAADELRDRGPAARALRTAARAARARGRLRHAERWYEDAFAAARIAGATDDAVIAATGRGNVAVDRGRWDEAARWYEDALALIGTEGDPRRERWQLFQNLSIVARRRGALDQARAWLERAAAEAAAVGDAWAEAEIGNGRGQVALEAGEAVEAEEQLRAALERAQPGRTRTAVLLNLTQALIVQRRALEAAEVARDAEREALTRGVVAFLPEVYRLLARIAAQRGHEESFVFLERALEWAARSGSSYQRGLTQEAYAESDAERGETESARARLRDAAALYEEGGNDADKKRVLARLDQDTDQTHEPGYQPADEPGDMHA